MNKSIAGPTGASCLSMDAGFKRRTELRATLQRIILKDGFANLSVSEMAQRLGCSKRTIYELAPTKNALVLQVLSIFFETIRNNANIACASRNEPAEQLFEYLQVGVRAAQHLSPRAITDIDNWPPARQMWQEHLRLRVEGLRDLIERGVNLGAFRDRSPMLVAEMVYAGIRRLCEPDFYESQEFSPSQAFEEYYNMLLSSLTYPKVGG